MRISILSLLCIFLFIPLVVNAKYDVTNPNCTNEEKIKLRDEAGKIKYITDKYTENNNVYYSIEMLDLKDTINIEDTSTKQVYKSSGEKILKITPGGVKSLLVYASDKSVCSGYSIFTKNIVIPYYNKYKDNSLCVGNEEHVLCKENTSIQIGEDEFIRIMKAYIKEKSKTPDEEPIEQPNEENLSTYNKIMYFLADYYVYILLGIIVLGISGIIILEIRRRRSIL